MSTAALPALMTVVKSTSIVNHDMLGLKALTQCVLDEFYPD
jgi:hypothetical protein